jgi:hypothetical protein
VCRNNSSLSSLPFAKADILSTPHCGTIKCSHIVEQVLPRCGTSAPTLWNKCSHVVEQVLPHCGTSAPSLWNKLTSCTDLDTFKAVLSSPISLMGAVYCLPFSYQNDWLSSSKTQQQERKELYWVLLKWLSLKPFKKWHNSPNSGRISKIMLPPESLSQYLSNEYQRYGVSLDS